MADVPEQRHHFGLLGVLELLGLLNCQRGKRRNNREESEVVIREGPYSFVQYVQDADGFASPASEGHRDHVPRDEPGGLVDLLKMGGVVVDPARNPWLSRLEDRPGNALIPGNGCPSGNRLFTDRI